MANLNKIKAGSTDPAALMFDEYKTTRANGEISFGSIIPVDNSNEATLAVSKSVWQVNNGWEVEIISNKRIAIKKFKIDTWGLRQIIGNPHTNPDYNNLMVNISGINMVHKEVICHTAGSNTPDGFTKAYGGNGGYDVYWYPGKYTSGSSMQGLVIQFGVGYTANDNERADSLQIGKHPWDVGTKSCTVDGIVTGTWADVSYRAITIGLFGGVQNATAWHDESGDAYRQYDISDNPIYIDLDVPDTNAVIDVTSVECWDAYVGEDKVYHKDKTLENCWKKYGLAFPADWNIIKTNFNTNDYIEWVSPTKFKIKGIPTSGIYINTTAITSYSNYKVINWKPFVAKLSEGLPAGASVKIVRNFKNAYYNYDDTTHTWSNPVKDIETVLSVGDNTIAAFSKEIYKKNTDISMVCTECRIIITSDTPIYSMNCTVELVPTFTEGELLNVIESRGGLSKIKVPPIVDLIPNIDRLMFNINPVNADFWTPIKEYYATHVLEGDSVSKKFYYAKNLDELSLILPDKSWLSYDSTFKNSSIKKLTFTGQARTNITSLNGIFEGMKDLKELIVNVDKGHNGNYLAGANDCSNMFNYCGLATYPSNFICWDAFRSNAQHYSQNATNAKSLFYNSGIEVVPDHGTAVNAGANTILCGEASGMFCNCKKLTTVGPIIDLCLIDPKNAEKIFEGCTALTSIRIRNLNHGDWRFDNTAFEGTKKHGTLAALNDESIQYLFANLRNLNLYDPNKNIETVSNSFSKWQSDYFESGIFESSYNFKFNSMFELVAKMRSTGQISAPFIVHTTATDVYMSFKVSGLVQGDSIIFGAAGSTEPDLTITKDGEYNITKNDDIDKGFKLIGNISTDSPVTITVNRGWDLFIPKVQSANLYCPAEWGEFTVFDFTKMNNNYLVSQTPNKITLNGRRNTSSTDTSCWLTLTSNLSITIKVEGLIEGDTLGVGNGKYSSIQYKITANGSYKIEFNSGVTFGFKLWNDSNTTDKTVVSVSVDNTPAKVTSDMITAAKAKNWNVYIGGNLKTV